MISGKTLVWFFGSVLAVGAQLSFALADGTLQTAGELLEIRLEGAGVTHPVRLELELPTQGMASKMVGPLSQSVANALRQCKGLPELLQNSEQAIQIDLHFENGLLANASSRNIDLKGPLPCALKSVEASKVNTFPLSGAQAKGVLRIRASEG